MEGEGEERGGGKGGGGSMHKAGEGKELKEGKEPG